MHSWQWFLQWFAEGFTEDDVDILIGLSRELRCLEAIFLEAPPTSAHPEAYLNIHYELSRSVAQVAPRQTSATSSSKAVLWHTILLGHDHNFLNPGSFG